MSFVKRLNQNPWFKTEQDYLRGNSQGLLSWGYLPLHFLLLLGLGAAGLPLISYFTVNQERLLAACGTVVEAVSLLITLRPLLLGARVMAHDLTPGRRPALIASPLDARQIVLGQWWAVVRQTWLWLVLIGLIRAGFALAVAQRVYHGAFHDDFSDPFVVLNYPNLGYLRTPHAQPAFYQGGLAILTTLGLGCLQAGLMSALGMLSALIAHPRRISPRFVALLAYFVLHAAALGMFASSYDYIGATKLHLAQNISYYSYSYSSYYYYDSSKSALRLMETASCLTLIDGGVLIAADLLRPLGFSVHLLRCGMSAVLGGSLHLILIAVCLWRAWRGLVKLGAPALSSLTLRQRFGAWRHSPITIAQQHALQRHWLQRRGVRTALWALFAAALPVACLPFWTYLHCKSIHTIGLIAGAVYTFHAVVALITITVATHSFRRENEPEAWDVLILTTISARRIVWGKWWAVLRVVWIYWLLAAVLKLGLAIGLRQYWADARNARPFTSLQLFFAYMGDNFIGPGCGYYHSLSQHDGFFHFHGVILWPWLKILVILAVFSLLEAGLLSALGILSALMIKKMAALQVALAVFLRLIPLTLVALFLQLSTQFYFVHIQHPDSSANVWTRAEDHNRLRVMDSLWVTASPQLDGGLTSLNLIGWGEVWPLTLAYRQRQWSCLLAGAAIYAGLVRLGLALAQRVAVRRGALPS